MTSDVSDSLSAQDTTTIPFFSTILRTKAINKFLNNPYYGLAIIPADDSKKLASQNNQVFASIRKQPAKKAKPKAAPEPLHSSQSWSLSTKLKIFFIVVIHIVIVIRTVLEWWTSYASSTIPPTPAPITMEPSSSKRLFVNITAPEENFPSSSGLLSWSLNGSYLKPSVFNSKFNLSVHVFVDEQRLHLANDTGLFVNQIPSGKVMSSSSDHACFDEFDSWTCLVTWPSITSLKALTMWSFKLF